MRPDCPTTRSVRYRLLPIVSLLADRLSKIVAPAIAWKARGGIGTHRSSQISMPTITLPYPGVRSARLGLEQQIDSKRDTQSARARSRAVRAAAAGLNHRLS